MALKSYSEIPKQQESLTKYKGSIKRNLYYVLDTNAILDFLGGSILDDPNYSCVYCCVKTPKYFNEIAVFRSFKRIMEQEYRQSFHDNHKTNLFVGITSTIYNEAQKVIRTNKHPFIRRFIKEFNIIRVEEERLRQIFLDELKKYFKPSWSRLNVEINSVEEKHLYSLLNKIYCNIKGKIGEADKRILIEASSLPRFYYRDSALIFSADKHLKFYDFACKEMSKVFSHYSRISVINHRFFNPVRRLSGILRSDYEKEIF